MRIVRSVRAMQKAARGCRETGTKIGFVPTMGWLHAGHLSLVERARQAVGRQGRVVVSIYVNPTQFGPTEDFTTYPRDLSRDAALCRKAGVDILFAPSDAKMYPGRAGGGFSTYVSEEALSRGLEGRSRPAHFRGVTTVVAKLFNIVGPDVAVFGQKDYQQAAVVRRMVQDLNFPVQVVVAPTVREPDGLAMSSRNQYLAPADRQQSTVLWHAIQLAQSKVRTAKAGVPARKLQEKLTEFITQQTAARIDYISFFDPVSLEPVERVERGAQLALAVTFGKTRLIDNARM